MTRARRGAAAALVLGMLAAPATVAVAGAQTPPAVGGSSAPAPAPKVNRPTMKTDLAGPLQGLAVPIPAPFEVLPDLVTSLVDWDGDDDEREAAQAAAAEGGSAPAKADGTAVSFGGSGGSADAVAPTAPVVKAPTVKAPTVQAPAAPTARSARMTVI